MSINDILKSCPIFFELYDDEIEKVVKNCKVFGYDQGSYIAKEGEKATEIMVLLSGTAIEQKRINGQTVVLERVTKGNIFGFVVLIEESTYSTDIVAETSVDILKIPFDHLLGFYKIDPKIFGVITLNLSRIIAQRLTSLKEKIYNKAVELEKIQSHIKNRLKKRHG